MTTKQLTKKANEAPKYVLEMDGLGLYVSDKQHLTGCNLTASIKKARQYSVGFDNSIMKIAVWEKLAKKMLNNNDVQFNVVNL